MRYVARDGKVYADGREVSTALSANGRDLERFDRALDIARKQREAITPKLLLADDLKPGDTFHKEGVLVTVLKDKEPCSDAFGQDLFRYWCRREDTKVEAYCTFGRGGVVHR